MTEQTDTRVIYSVRNTPTKMAAGRRLLVSNRWRLGPVVTRPRHLHEELPQLGDVIVEGGQGRSRVLLALLDEIPQAHVVHELEREQR